MNTVLPVAAEAAAPLALAGSPGFRAPAGRLDDLPGPRRLPLVGNMHQMKAGSFHALFEGWSREFGPMYRFRLRSLDAVGIAEPGLIHELLRHRPVELARSPRVSQLIEELGVRGVFTAEGERWRRQRKLVMRALTPEALKHFFPIVASVTERLRRRWHDAVQAGRPLNVPRDLKRYSVDVTMWLAMGVDVNTLDHDDNSLQEDAEFWFATVGRRLASVLPYWRHFKLPADRRTDETMARLGQTVRRLIADARERLAADPALRDKPGNILEALVAARDEPDSEFDDDDVHGNVATMLFAGEDTTANAMAWLVYFLAADPGAARRAAAEADAVLGAALTPPAFHDVDRLVYLEAAVIESMRLKPIAPVQGMRANVDLDLAGLAVPRGTLLFLLPRIVATDAAHFEQPLAFRPERWLEGAPAADEARRKLFPFGGGPRFCPGRYLAMLEMRMVGAMALRNFGWSLEIDPARVEEHFTFTLGPKTLPVRCALR